MVGFYFTTFFSVTWKLKYKPDNETIFMYDENLQEISELSFEALI